MCETTRASARSRFREKRHMDLEWMYSRQKQQHPDAHQEQEWHGQAGKSACVSFDTVCPVGKTFHQVRAPFLVRFSQKQDALAASPVSSALLPLLREQAANAASVAALCAHT